MKRFFSLAVILGLASLGPKVMAQARTSQDQAGAAQQQQQPVDAQSQSARAFEGKIAKAGDKLVLQETSTKQAYQLDDQDKAKQFEGKRVKIMATMDPSTDTLHVVDITPAER